MEVLPTSLHQLSLEQNPWQCDCRQLALKRWLERTRTPLSAPAKCGLIHLSANHRRRRQLRHDSNGLQRQQSDDDDDGDDDVEDKQLHSLDQIADEQLVCAPQIVASRRRQTDTDNELALAADDSDDDGDGDGDEEAPLVAVTSGGGGGGGGQAGRDWIGMLQSAGVHIQAHALNLSSIYEYLAPTLISVETGAPLLDSARQQQLQQRRPPIKHIVRANEGESSDFAASAQCIMNEHKLTSARALRAAGSFNISRTMTDPLPRPQSHDFIVIVRTCKHTQTSL